MSTESLEKNGEGKDAGVEVSPWRTLFRLARPFRARILIIILLAALSTGATLIEPLIYRVAVNDVSGLFVRKAQEQNEQHEEAGSPKHELTPGDVVMFVACATDLNRSYWQPFEVLSEAAMLGANASHARQSHAKPIGTRLRVWLLLPTFCALDNPFCIPSPASA